MAEIQLRRVSDSAHKRWITWTEWETAKLVVLENKQTNKQTAVSGDYHINEKHQPRCTI